MSNWSTSVIVLLGCGAVARVVARATRLSPLRRPHRAGPGALLRLDAGRLRAALVERRSTRRSVDAPAAFAEAVARELRAGCALPEALALGTATVGPASSARLDVLVRLGSEVGGELADAFDAFAAGARDDLALRDEVGALTAQSRASAILLTALPLAGSVLMGVLQPSTTAFLVASPAGRACLGAAVALLAAGWAWMGSMVRSL